MQRQQIRYCPYEILPPFEEMNVISGAEFTKVTIMLWMDGGGLDLRAVFGKDCDS
jgi:hypothetical protein